MEWPRITPTRRQFLQSATSAYQQALWGDFEDAANAVAYLKERGFTREVSEAYQLGYVRAPFDGHENVRGYLSFPFRSFSGPAAIRFRQVGSPEFGKRWLAETGQSVPLYNVLDLHRPEPYVAICEGQTDTVTMSGLVGVPTVGISGAALWKSFWDHLFVDYETVFVVVDPDTAGDNAAKKLLERLGHNAKQVRLPADVNQVYLTEGSEFIKGKLGV